MNENQSLISKHAKSFSWAGFFLSKENFQKCSALYDFCRTIDDIADGNSELNLRKKELAGFKSYFKNKNFSNSIIKNMHHLLKENNISYKIIEDLFDGIESDLRHEINFTTQKELLIYSYRVAGTVGLMMAKILNVKDRYSFKCAIDLGIAMQLTNIARDVVEDKKKNRAYIKHNFNSIKETLTMAESFYLSSFSAIKFIPAISRLSIIIALRLYKKIGDEILKKKNLEEYNNAGKIYVSNLSKVFEIVLSFFDFIRLFFIRSNKNLTKNQHIIINEEINLDERI